MMAPTTTTPPDTAFSVNLLKNAKNHIFFLQELHPLFIKRPTHKSLQRYRNYWLPLLHEHSELQLAPPPDIAWLWHCHRLAPFRYTAYLKTTYGSSSCNFEANPPFCFQQLDGRVIIFSKEEVVPSLADETRRVWNEMYPDEPFFLNEEDEQDAPTSSSTNANDLLGGFDLLESTDRQATFLWQVSGPNFDNDDFLKEGIVQYYKFLKLRKKASIRKNMVLVPTYQIDLMWHTHILTNLTLYYEDCEAIMGSTMNHDDSFTDRSTDGPLDRAFNDTKALWKETYNGEEYFAAGGMYRGEPPKEYYLPSWTHMPKQGMSVMCPSGHFLHFIDIQGASSTNPTAYDQTVIWCWKETPSQMTGHDASEIVGDSADCWIKYNDTVNLSLESLFASGVVETFDLGNGYFVDFKAMKQVNKSTGYQRDVQRHSDMTNVTIVKPMIWVWKETESQMSNHPAESIFGDPKHCWIKYDATATAKLENAFHTPGKDIESPMDGYTVNFATMKQRNLASWYKRDVQRFDPDAFTSHHNDDHCPWTPLEGIADVNGWDFNAAFVPAEPKSTTKGVNSNPMKPGYIFGRQNGKVGYYHITTKEAYIIMASRIQVEIRNTQDSYAFVLCLTCGLGGKQLQSKIEDLKEIKDIAIARANAPTRKGIVGLRPEIQQDESKRRVHYSDTGDWYFPACYESAAGGCGGGVHLSGASRAAGCVAAAAGCGAAGCGAAACGGGGCVGGGCGGGGCGGGG